MNDRFKIAKLIKDFIFSLDVILICFPRRDFELRNRLVNDSYKLLNLVYYCNLLELKDRLVVQKEILSLINMIDFYLEFSFKKKIISEKACKSRSNNLLIITKMVYKWIEDGKC